MIANADLWMIANADLVTWEESFDTSWFLWTSAQTQAIYDRQCDT